MSIKPYRVKVLADGSSKEFYEGEFLGIMMDYRDSDPRPVVIVRLDNNGMLLRSYDPSSVIPIPSDDE